ncbi:MAG: DUF3179 domain-containing protein [Chloroflexi bacterium]|nr:DUF3179 domain-containing protein [Chloroflexota bacterium]
MIIEPKIFLILSFAVVISNCGIADGLVDEQSDASTENNPETNLQTPTLLGDTAPGETTPGSATPVPTNARVEDPNEYNFPFLIPFDGIRPIYDPEFVSADQSPLIDEELIIGVAWGGEAKAYPITVLRFREMVDDELAGIPTLVTW